MVLGSPAPQFPFDTYLQAKTQYSPKFVAGQALGDVTNQIPDMINIYQQGQKKKQWETTIDQLMQDPSMPDQYKQYGGVLKQVGPERGLELINSFVRSNRVGVSGKSTWYQSPDGSISKNQVQGSIPLQISDSQAVQYTGVPKSKGSSAVNWDTSSQEDKDLAKARYEGRIRASDMSFRDRSVSTSLAEQYAIKNNLPPFKAYSADVAAGTARAFSSGKPAMNTLALNTALGHLETASNAYDAIKNMDASLLNKPFNAIRKAGGDAEVTKLVTALNAVKGEAANVFKTNGATDQEIQSWSSSINENLSPEQSLGTISMLDELFRSRLKALEYMRSSGMGGRAEGSLLSPKAKGISMKLGKDNPSNGGSRIGRFEVQVTP